MPLSGGGVVSLTDCKLYGNQAIVGGAIQNTKGTITLMNCELYDNHADENGGAVYNEGNMTLTACMFTSNNATKDGGAVYNEAGTITSIDTCTFTSNTPRKRVVPLSTAISPSRAR